MSKKIVYNVVEIRNGKLIGISSFSSLSLARECFDVSLKTFNLKEKFNGYVNNGEFEIALTHNQVDWRIGE